MAVLLCGCAHELTPDSPAPVQPESKEISSSIPGTAYVMFSDKACERIENDEFDKGLGGIGITSLERIIPDGGKYDRRHHEAGLHKWYKVEFSKLVPATKAAQSFNSMDGVVSVSFPHKIKANSNGYYFNDPYFYLQWNLYNDGSLPSSLGPDTYLPGSDANVRKVWEEYTAGSKDVLVAVLDDGVDIEDGDFAGVVIPPGVHGSQCFVDGFEGNTLYPDNHGCHVAGIIGAINNNNFGVASVAGGSDGTGGVRILSCGIFLTNPDDRRDYRYSSDDNIMKAFVHAADEGAVIANNSWGFVFDNDAEAQGYSNYFESTESPIRSGIDYFIDYAGFDENGKQIGPMAGGLVVFSSGNEGHRHSCPAEYSRVLAVAAHGPHFNCTDYSNYGPWVDIVAPGGSVDYAEKKEPYGMIIGPAGGGEYYYFGGTSQAAPHVSGVAALLVSYFGGEGFSPDLLKEYILAGARSNALTGNLSGPMLDAYGSFDYAANGTGGEISIIPPFEGDCSVMSHETKTLEFRIYGNRGKKLPSTVKTECKAISFTDNSYSVTIMVDALKEAPGTYPVGLCVGEGTEDEVSYEFNLTILPNNAPEVSAPMPDVVFNIDDEDTMSWLPEYFSDPDGEELTYDVEVEDSDVVFMEWLESLMLFAPADYGTTKVTVTAYDARKASASQSFSICVRDTSRDFDLYPNPVHDNLYVRSGTEAKTFVWLYNANGDQLYYGGETTSPFKPMSIDVSRLVPGQYFAKVVIGGKVTNGIVVVKK